MAQERRGSSRTVTVTQAGVGQLGAAPTRVVSAEDVVMFVTSEDLTLDEAGFGRRA